MGLKVEACRFALAGGDARIGSLEDARRIFTGNAGTRIHREEAASTYWLTVGPASGEALQGLPFRVADRRLQRSGRKGGPR